jgi:hypothetical protein
MFLLIASQLVVLPVLGLIWLGIRNERLNNERLLRQAIRNMIIRSTIK